MIPQARKRELLATGVTVSYVVSGGGSVQSKPGSTRSSILADVEKIRLGILEILEGDVSPVSRTSLLHAA